jgi:phosphatidylserine decarboxylase
MSFSFSSLVRLIVIMALSTTMLAIGIAKLDPPRPVWRNRVAARYSNLNEFFMNFTERTPRWLDAESGRVVSSPLDDGDVLEAASCSPWVDEKGQFQVAGRWSSRTSMGPMSVSTDFGLARYSFPAGQLLDHVSTEIVPVGPPCWFPGTRARILFAGGDGELYHYAFEADPFEKGLDPEAKRDARPIPLKWRCPKPGLGKVFLSDLTWPQDPRLIGYVVVALREQSPDSETLRAFTGTSLWWLKLDFAGTEIVEVGRLLLPADDSDPNNTIDSRSPTVGTLPNGKTVLAYLTEGKRKLGWELRVAPIEFEGDQHIPRARAATGALLSTGCQPAHPSFSADGRWLNAVAESTEPNGRIIRLPLSGLFPASQ